MRMVSIVIMMMNNFSFGLYLMITLKKYTSTPAPANFSFLYQKLASKQRYTAKHDEKPLVQQKISLKKAGGFESGKIFGKILFLERQNFERVLKRQEGLKVGRYLGKYPFWRGKSLKEFERGRRF